LPLGIPYWDAQVLREFYVTVTRKIRKPLSPELAVGFLDEYRGFPTVPTDYPLIVEASSCRFATAHPQLDGAIVAARKLSRPPPCTPGTCRTGSATARCSTSIDAAVAQRSARLHVPDPRPLRDGLIAATALVHGMTVVTRNGTDFAPTGVRTLDPWAAT
jgi:hypothetical protein